MIALDVLLTFLYLLCSATFIAGVWWGMLRVLDRTAGVKFSAKFKIMETDPMALAVYFGCRLLALAILFAPLLRVIL
jgi:hypothetical protein